MLVFWVCYLVRRYAIIECERVMLVFWVCYLVCGYAFSVCDVHTWLVGLHKTFYNNYKLKELSIDYYAQLSIYVTSFS